MKLMDWEIWHTYSTYFTAPIRNLDEAAESLVDNGVARCAFVSSGSIYWCDDGVTKKGNASVELSTDRRHSKINIESTSADPFVFESFLDACYLKFIELQQFGEGNNVQSPYIRAFVGEYWLTAENNRTYIYPNIKLYSSGVILVEMRILSPDEAISLERFIDEHVNLSMQAFTEVWIPPKLVYPILKGEHLYINGKVTIPQSIRFRLQESGIQSYIESNSMLSDNGEFRFDLVPILKRQNNDKLPEGLIDESSIAPVTQLDLAVAIVGATCVSISASHSWPLTSFRQADIPARIGESWTCKPHIHISRHEEQKTNAADNEKSHKDSFGWVMGRLVEEPFNIGRTFLPKDSRIFNDYSAYVDLQGSLWVWSTSGVQEVIDSSVSTIFPTQELACVFENQPKVEYLEYVYMLHLRLLNRIGQTRSSYDVFELHNDFLELKLGLRESSVFGETRDLLTNGWQKLGIPAVQEGILESIEIRKVLFSTINESRAEGLALFVAVTLGFLSLPAFASSLIEPLWSYFGLWLPLDPASSQLFIFVVSSIFIASILFFGSRIIFKRNRIRRQR